MCGTHVSELVTTVTEAFPVGQTLSQAEQGCDLGQSPPLWSSIATSVNENNSFRVVRKFNEKKNQSYSWNFGYQNFPVSIRHHYFFFILTTTFSDQHWFRTLRTGTSRVMSKVTHLRRWWIWDSKPGLSRTQAYVSN